MGTIAGVKSEKLHKDAITKLMLNMFSTTYEEGEVSWETTEKVGLGFVNDFIEYQDEKKAISYNLNDWTLHICMDGKVDNRDEICNLLNIENSNDLTDHFLVCLLYYKFKDDFPGFLKGQFAISLYDENNDQVCLVKDPIGLKQLFYYVSDTEVFWFTEIKQLKNSMPLEVNLSYIEKYLGSQPGAYADTAYNNLFRVEAGEIILIKNSKKITKNKYYSFPNNPLMYKNEVDYIERFRELFKVAVKRSIPSKSQQIGFSLSGGLDSSSIYSYAKYHKFVSPSNAATFSYTFKNNADADETEYIKEVLRYYPSTKQHFFDCSDEWCFKGGLNTFGEQDEPYPLYGYSLSSIIPRAVRKSNIKVLVSGHCGDHVLMGNLNYLYNLLSTFQLNSYIKHLGIWREQYTLRSLLLKYSRRPKSINVKAPLWLKNNSSFNDLNQEEVCWDDQSRKKYFDGIVYQSGHEWVTQYISKQFGVETRYPFMDIDLMEFLLNIPVHLKQNPKYDKYILKEASKGILPDKIRNRRQKAGHSNLITRGIKKEWGGFQNHLNLEALESLNFVDSEQFQKTIKEFYMGKINNYSDIVPITRTLSAEVWLKERLG